MANKISKITIRNYGAYYNESGDKDYVFNVDGKNLLLYGENGSGKSSLYRALKDFFESSEKNPVELPFNRNKFVVGLEPAYVKVEIDSTEFIFDSELGKSNTFHDDNLMKINKNAGFLDYKNILRTYLIQETKDKNPNLFELFVLNILAEINRPGSSNQQIGDVWKSIEKIFEKPDWRTVETKEKGKLISENSFASDLDKILDPIVKKVNHYLDIFFDYKLSLKTGIDIHFINDWSINKELFFETKYAGVDLNGYHDILNEARLSAIGICIYLASLKLKPPSSDLKVLFLDDIFIGLDSANRIPLLKIIKEEFLSEWQILITTYDRAWFEFSRQWFKIHATDVFTSSEVYCHKSEVAFTPDKPVIIQSKSQLKKAEAYYEAKDYPAA